MLSRKKKSDVYNVKIQMLFGGPWYKHVEMGVPGTNMLKWGSVVKSILMSNSMV